MDIMKVKNFIIRNDLFYTKTDEWVKLDGDLATIGITDYAQKQLRDIVGVDLPERGKRVEKGDTIATVDSVKAVSDIYSPVSGVVYDVNETLLEAPQLINNDPYESGWIVKVKLENNEELRDLLSPQQYAELILERIGKK
ncbi:MAG: glycine cleavage system protein GcvH [Fervidicoccaceae archaeon]|jgi:glycine cleavage system H protein|nr:MAG: glycine cleavage system protein H [Fervidicoccus sp.]